MFIKDLLKFLSSAGIPFAYHGDENLVIQSFCSLSNIQNDCIMFSCFVDLDFIRLLDCYSNILLVSRPFNYDTHINRLWVDSARPVFFEILNHFFYKEDTDLNSAGDSSSLILTSNIGQGVSIGKLSLISNESIIGDNVKIGNHVTLSGKVIVGDNSIISSGAVIGVNACSFYILNGKKKPVPHFGGVRIGHSVFIGANTVIERGTIDDTIIGDEVKISSLCSIEHNVVIKQRASITSGCVIAGSVLVEEQCRIHPNSSISRGVVLGRHSLVGIGSIVLRNVGENEVVAGNPAKFLRFVNFDDLQKFPF